MSIPEFLEEYNKLVIGGEPTAFYQLIHAASGEVWHTFPSPADEEKVKACVSNIGSELPTGRHSVRLQALRKDNGIVAQTSIDVEGRSAAAKHSANEQVQHAKALQMNIDTADGQLVNMSRRLDESEERCRVAENRAGEMTNSGFQMQELMHKMLMQAEGAKLDEDERRARMESFSMIGSTLAPILGQAIQIGSAFVEVWVEEKKADMEARARSRARERAREEAEDKAKTNGATVSVSTESPN